MQATTIYFVGIDLQERVHWGCFGFTSYIICFVKANNETEAGNKAKAYFESKYKITVVKATPQIALEQDESNYTFPEHFIK